MAAMGSLVIKWRTIKTILERKTKEQLNLSAATIDFQDAATETKERTIMV